MRTYPKTKLHRRFANIAIVIVTKSTAACSVYVPDMLFKKSRMFYTQYCYRIKIKVKYVTSPSASALQWLEPGQTSGKKHPYLFSQCQVNSCKLFYIRVFGF